IRRHLVELAGQARREADERAGRAAGLFEAARRAANPGALVLDVPALRAQPELAADAVRAGFARVGGPARALGRRATERLLALRGPGGPLRTDLGGGWTAEREGHLLHICRPGPVPARVELVTQPLPVPGRVELAPAGLWIDACPVPVPDALRED